jgi:hypothetical protein
MELFSEIYGCYYTVLARVLERAHPGGLTRADIEAIMKESGFADTAFHLLPKLISGEWPLLKPRDGRFYSILSSEGMQRPLSTLEKAWLKSLLHDPRMRLFLHDDQIKTLDEALRIEPLFLPGDFHIIDAALDGDPYDDPAYRGRFRLILNAARAHTPLYIEYEGGKGRMTCGVYAPWRLSYSAKDDKFRLLAAACFKTRSRRAILNLSRICHVAEAADASKMAGEQVERYFAESSRQPSFLLRIYPERNALERAMLQFAAYRKETEYDEPSNTYLCRVYHDPTEETELLIRVLSFGPTVKVLEPPGFAAQLKERIVRQLDLNDANALKEQDICEPSSQFERGHAL